MKKFLSLALALLLSLTACGGSDSNPVNVAADREKRIEKIIETVPTEEPLKIPKKKPVTVESLKVETPEPVAPVEAPVEAPVVLPEPVPVPVVTPEAPVAPIPTVEPVEVPMVHVAPMEYVVDAPEFVEPVTVPVAPVEVEPDLGAMGYVQDPTTGAWISPEYVDAPSEAAPLDEGVVAPVAPKPVPVAPVAPPVPVEKPWQLSVLEAAGLDTAGLTVISTDDARNCGGVGGGCAQIGARIMWVSPSTSSHVIFHEYAHAVHGTFDECAAEEFAWSMTGDRQMASYPNCLL